VRSAGGDRCSGPSGFAATLKLLPKGSQFYVAPAGVSISRSPYHLPGSQSKWNLIPGLDALLVKRIVAIVDRFRRLRGFSRPCTVSVLRCPIQNLQLVGYDFDYGALFAFRPCPFPSLQPAFQINVPLSSTRIYLKECVAASYQREGRHILLTIVEKTGAIRIPPGNGGCPRTMSHPSTG